MGTLYCDMCTVSVILHIWTSSRAHPFFFCRGEVNFPQPSVTRLKNVRDYTSSAPYIFIAWHLIKQRQLYLPLHNTYKAIKTLLLKGGVFSFT